MKATVRVSFPLLLLFAFFPYTVSAQIAPTNSATISGSVSDSAGKPVAHAKVSLSGPKSTSTQTDAQGLFVFIGVPFGTYSISAAATGLGTATRSVSVQGDVNVAIQYEPASMNGLKVIANVSSSANAHFNVTPASITQVNPIANAFEGKTSWRTILEQIPGVAQAGLGNGANELAAYPDGPLMPMKISINGALPYETAALLDDMPLIGTSLPSSINGAGTGTDLSVYPLNGFDSADVVRGPGANAPSIVDSIGGSFVLHSPGVVDHNQYDLSLITEPYGGIVANARAAVRWKKLSAVVTYGINDSPGPINTSGIAANALYGMGIATVDGHSFTAYTPPICNPPGCQYGSFLVAPGYSTATFPFYGYQGGMLVCCANYSSAWTQHSGSVAFRYGFSPNVSAEIFYAGEIRGCKTKNIAGGDYPSKATTIFYKNGPTVEMDEKGMPYLRSSSIEKTPYYMEAELNSPMAVLGPGETYAFDTTWYAIAPEWRPHHPDRGRPGGPTARRSPQRG